MKKAFRYVLIAGLIISSSFTNIDTVTAQYRVYIGGVYNYTLKTAQQTVIFNQYESYIGNGTFISNCHFDQNDVLSYKIIDVTENSVEFNLSTSDDYIILQSINALDINTLKKLAFEATQPNFVDFLDHSDHSEKEELMKGYYMELSSPFLEASDSVWDELKEIENYLNEKKEYAERHADVDFRIKSDVKQEDQLLTIETYLGGTIQGDYFGVYVDEVFNNQLKFAYNTKKGVLQGLHLKAWMEGHYDGWIFEYTLDYNIELIDYTLGDFIFPTLEFMTSFNYLDIIGIAVLVLIAIDIKRKKK